MAKLLVVYGSTEGHTLRLARFVLGAVRAAGFGAELADADDLYRSARRGDYDAFIIGASVHHGERQSAVVNFVKDKLELLNELPSAFFSVSLNAALADSEHQAEAQVYLADFLGATGWRPARTQLVGGALRNTELDYFRRELARHIVGRTLGPTDKETDYDLTDYDALSAFVTTFLETELRPNPETARGAS